MRWLRWMEGEGRIMNKVLGWDRGVGGAGVGVVWINETDNRQ